MVSPIVALLDNGRIKRTKAAREYETITENNVLFALLLFRRCFLAYVKSQRSDPHFQCGCFEQLWTRELHQVSRLTK